MSYHKDPKLKVIVRRPQSIEWEGMAWAISSTNSVGPFDVLPEHTQFMGLITDYVVIHEKDSDKRISLSEAIIKVENNQVEIWLRE